jgi:hypothetical protein
MSVVFTDHKNTDLNLMVEDFKMRHANGQIESCCDGGKMTYSEKCSASETINQQIDATLAARERWTRMLNASKAPPTNDSNFPYEIESSQPNADGCVEDGPRDGNVLEALEAAVKFGCKPFMDSPQRTNSRPEIEAEIRTMDGWPLVNSKAIADTLAERGKSYGDAKINCSGIGLQWTAILRNHFQREDIPIIPGNVVALMMVGLKLNRLAKSPDHEDSDHDARAYLSIAKELA